MATLDERLSVDWVERRCAVAQEFVVFVKGLAEDGSQMQEMEAFCTDPDHAGRFDFLPDDVEEGDRVDVWFFFTDETTAFEFKMRFA